MHGCGNDYIYVDTMQYPIADPVQASILWSDRHKGIGSDGLVLIGASPIPEADYSMRIFNADGSEAMMCGNASRCIGKYLYERGLTPRSAQRDACLSKNPSPRGEGSSRQEMQIKLLTNSGIKTLFLHIKDDIVESVTVDMGDPFWRMKISLTHKSRGIYLLPSPFGEGMGVRLPFLSRWATPTTLSS